MKHPSSIDLEAYACEPAGSDPRGAHAKVREHLALCSACCDYVERITSFAQAAQPPAADVAAHVARAMQGSLEHAPDAPHARVAGAARPLSSVASLAAARARRLVGMVAPLAAVAAALFFFVRTRPDLEVGKPAPRGDDVAGTASVPTLDRVQMGEVPSPGSPSSHEPETTFKGGMQLAVVRDRRGDQARFAGGPALRVRPGDRLRVEVALDREEAILGGVLADDGEYLELMPLAVRGPGTHLSERSAKIDASPSSGTIVIGTPEAIARVRATRQIAGVAAVRVEWEGGQ